jgi:hypothetical protein
MSRPALIAWLLTAVFVVAAIVAAATQVTHWKRTVAVAVVLAVISAGYAVTRPRVTA